MFLLGTLKNPMLPLPCSIMLPAKVPAVGTDNETSVLSCLPLYLNYATSFSRANRQAIT